jgi:hypothetical protein
MKRLRLLTVAAATAVAGMLGALVAPISPAQAAPYQEGYAFVDRSGVGQTGYVYIDGTEIVICPQCYRWIGVVADLPPESVYQINKGLLTGLQGLGKAASTKDPVLSQRYRDEALQAFIAAASGASRGTLRPGQVGYYDAARGVTVPQDLNWLAAAAQDLVDGVTVLQESPTLPLPPPRAALAMAQFDEAYGELVAHRPIGT